MTKRPIAITILGFAGFVFACFILFYNGCKNKSSFHEVEYDQVSIAKTILKEKAGLLKNRLDSIETLKANIDASKAGAEPLIHIFDSTMDSYSRSLVRIDTNYFTRYFDTTGMKQIELYLQSSIDLDSLVRFDSLFKKGNLNGTDTLYAGNTVYSSVKLNFLFFDPQLKKDTVYKRISLPIHNFYSDIDFFTKYPGFGIWALLIMTFCCCLFMTAGFCIHTGSELDRLTSSIPCENKLQYWSSFIICAILLGIFAFVSYLTFYDGETIRDIYFMKGLGNKVKLISLCGYTSAAFCFAGMVSVAAFAKCFKKRLDSIPEQPAIQATLTEKITEKETSFQNEPDPAKKTLIKAELDTLKKQLDASNLITSNAANDYETLRNHFRKFFYAIALLLALLTFCTGTLYSASDSLDFMKMIKDDMGFSPARHDFVYLYAALHTLLILLFYLPAQLLISNYKPPEPLATAGEQPGKGFLSGLKSQWGKLTEVLVVGAPLVASFAQWLLNMIFDG